MTTPGGVPNLPHGALTLDTLASKTQDMSQPAMKSRAVERFSSIFNNSTGLDPALDITPFGILTGLWSGFNSQVANADPANVQGPEDLPGLLLQFIEGLPVIGQFVDLLDAILGTYTGTDATLLAVQAIFAPIRAIVDALTAVAGGAGGLGNFFPDLLGLLGNPTGLGSGTVGLGSLSSIPILGPVLGLFGGATSATQASNFFTNLLSLLGGPALTGAPGSFNPVTAAEDFINTVLNPTGLLASIGAIVQALTGQSGSLNILGPLTGLFGPIIDLFDGTGSTTGASNFTDNGDGTGLFDLGALGNLIDNGDGTGMSVAGLLESLTGQLGTFQSLLTGQQTIIDGIFNAIRGGGISGSQPDVLEEALHNIPFLNVLGIGGPGNIGSSVQETWNQWISGLVGTVGTGAGLSDLFNIGQHVSSQAARGGMSFDILGIRNNKSLNTGFLPTSESNFGLDKVALAGSAPTFALTQSTAPMAFVRISESASKGVVSWLGSGVTNVTSAFVNIYKMNTGTGALALVHASSDIVGNLSSTMQHNIYSLPTPLQVEPGEVYGIEVAVRGVGTHSIVGSTTWLPDHPNVFPRRMSAVRNSGTSAAPSTLTPSYSSNVPFVEFGVSTGDVAIPHTPTTTLFNTAGSSTLPIPSWANNIDVVTLPGGGGGHQGGTWGVGGAGGDNGNWATITWTRGTHFSGATNLSITVGAGGSAGFGGSGGNGGATTVSIPGALPVTTAGGAGATSFDIVGSQHSGQSPGNLTYNGQTYVGGSQQDSYGAQGAAPGGGGAGGNWISFQPGGPGATGAVWIRAYQ